MDELYRDSKRRGQQKDSSYGYDDLVDEPEIDANIPPMIYNEVDRDEEQETEAHTAAAEKGRAKDIETADEEDVSGLTVQRLLRDPSPPEDTPVGHTRPLPAEITHPTQSDFPTSPLPPSDDTTVTDTEPGSTETFILIDESGGPYDVSRKGIFLEVPPNALTESTEITCTVQPKNYSPSPASDDETLVSNIVELGPYDVDIRQPITVNLMHSGPGRDLGYETVVKAFNQDKRVWEEIEELQNKRKNVFQEHYDCDFVQVQVAKMTTLAVVTKLVTDRFEITPRGGVVKSSVCKDVTIDFPEGAVDKKIGFTIKLLIMPEDILEDIEAYPFPILSIDGFNDVDLLKPATIQLPQPCLAKHISGQICLFRQRERATGNSEGRWMDITDEVHAYSDEQDPLVYLKVKRFSRLSAWIQRHSNDDRRSLKERLSSAFKFARRTPRSVCFAAFMEDVDDSHFNGIFTIKLLCADNSEAIEVSNQELKGFKHLTCISAKEKMRPEQKAYINVEGEFQLQDEDVDALRFRKGERFMTEIYVVDQAKTKENEEKEDDDFEKNARGNNNGLIIGFYEKPKKKKRLCRLSINKNKLYEKINAKRNENKAHELCSISLHDAYKMNSNPKGFFIIINMETFDKPFLSERKGSQKDATAMKKLFKEFGFVTKVLHNKNKEDLISHLKTISKKTELGRHDCFGLCIMSHGNDDCFYASDGEEIKVTDIRDMFTNAGCEGLKGKPKLFFIQACRGHSIDSGVSRDEPETIVKIPEQADILMAFSCVGGYPSYRYEDHGSFFIKSLVEVFREYAQEVDLTSMLEKVNNKVSKLVGSEEGKQISNQDSTLRKKVYFTKFETDSDTSEEASRTEEQSSM